MPSFLAMLLVSLLLSFTVFTPTYIRYMLMYTTAVWEGWFPRYTKLNKVVPFVLEDIEKSLLLSLPSAKDLFHFWLICCQLGCIINIKPWVCKMSLSWNVFYSLSIASYTLLHYLKLRFISPCSSTPPLLTPKEFANLAEGPTFRSHSELRRDNSKN